MNPQEMPQEQDQPQEGGGKEEAAALAAQVGDGLAKLSEMFKSEKLAMVMQGFVEAIEEQLGGGEGPEQVPADQGQMPTMAGEKGVPMGPNTRM